MSIVANRETIATAIATLSLYPSPASEAIFTAVGAKPKPITIITGPVTTEGKTLIIIPEPPQKIIRLKTKYNAPAAASPDRVSGKPYLSILKVIGAMKAKEDARYTGTLPPVTN